MNRILKFYQKVCQDGETAAKEYDTMIPDKIRVLKCVSFPDCTHIETIRLSFRLGKSNGHTSCSGVRQIVELEIETGYLPKQTVRDNLRRMLRNFRIYDIETMLDAFDYRRFYCRY